MIETQHSNANYDSQSPEIYYSLSLAEGFKPEEIDFTENPNILIEVLEFRGAVGIQSPVQAGILFNQDHSCWLTNLGRNGSIEVFRPENRRYRKLAYNQVAYLRHGDCVGVYGSFFRILFGYSKLQLKPISDKEFSKIRA